MTEITGITVVTAREIVTVETGEMTDVSPLERDIVAVVGIMMTIRDVLIMKMTGVETIEVHAKTILECEALVAVRVKTSTHPFVVVEVTAGVVVVDVVSRVRMAWVHLREDHPLPKELCPCFKGEERLLAGMFMLPDTSNTLLYRQNRPVLPFGFICLSRGLIFLTPNV